MPRLAATALVLAACVRPAQQREPARDVTPLVCVRVELRAGARLEVAEACFESAATCEHARQLAVAWGARALAAVGACQ